MPNVTYLEHFLFHMNEVELRVEVKHLLLLLGYLGDLTVAMGSSLAVVHSVFHIDEDPAVQEDPDY